MNGCDLGMLWDVNSGKPECDTYQVKITNFINNATGCGDGSQDGTSFFLVPEGSSPSRCFKFYDTTYVDVNEAIDRWAMVWTETQIGGNKQIHIKTFTSSMCGSGTSDYMFNQQFTGDHGTNKCLADGDHHVYLKWC